MVVDWATIAAEDGVLSDGVHPSELGIQAFTDVSSPPSTPGRPDVADCAVGRRMIAAPRATRIRTEIVPVNGEANVPCGPAGAGIWKLPGTRWPGTPFTDSVE